MIVISAENNVNCEASGCCQGEENGDDGGNCEDRVKTAAPAKKAKKATPAPKKEVKGKSGGKATKKK